MNPKMYKVRRPDTGQIGHVYEENIDEAISMGGEVIEDSFDAHPSIDSSTPAYADVSTQNAPEKKYKVRRPDTGQIGYVKESDLEEAKQMGGKVVPDLGYGDRALQFASGLVLCSA